MLNDNDTTSILCTNLKAVNRNFDSSKGATEIIRKLLTLFFLHKYMIMTYAV